MADKDTQTLEEAATSVEDLKFYDGITSISFPPVKDGWPKVAGADLLCPVDATESFGICRKSDIVFRTYINARNGRQYQIYPAGPIRKAWNWLRGYRSVRHE
jgi:hypothetical protein